METIELTAVQFTRLKNLIYDASGINLHEGKKELLKSKIAKRMRMTRKSLDEYLSLLASDQREIIEFIDTVTTNHSFFFRENNSIEYIIRQFCEPSGKKNYEFSVWCAACSTGDEPYSVAIQLLEADLKFSILATDISHTVLATATRGIYRTDKVRNVPMEMLRRYFKKGTKNFAGHVKVRPEVARHIRFEKFNLITDKIPGKRFDAVICRNVMIYFDQPTSTLVVNKLYEAVVPSGFFAIGNAESLMNLKHPFKSIPKVPSLYVK